MGKMIVLTDEQEATLRAMASPHLLPRDYALAIGYPLKTVRNMLVRRGIPFRANRPALSEHQKADIRARRERGELITAIALELDLHYDVVAKWCRGNNISPIASPETARPCPICGNPIPIKRGEQRKACSPECQYERKLRLASARNSKDGTVRRVCEVQAKAFPAPPVPTGIYRTWERLVFRDRLA